ncbi:MAG: hypothetical protein QOH69_832 [Actinomycetota bacterium]|jgi:hypothetical protein|nr:hypothetical protein [Actinomycetota bacterium]
MTAHLDWWPENTVVSPDDIVVCDVSLRRLVDVCGTPAVHSGASASSAPSTRRPMVQRTAVLVVRVVAMARHRGGCRVVQVDARLDNLRLIWSQARRVGGTRSSRTRSVLIVRRPGRVDIAESEDVISAALPANLRVGDLLAIPSRPFPVDPAHPRHPLTARTNGSPDSIFDSSLQLN